MKTVSASVLLVLLGVWAAWAISGGFEVLTSEQARRLEISRKQPAVPDVSLIDQSGQVFRFGDWVMENNKFLIVDFIYTSCQSFCRAQGTEFQQLQQSIVTRGLQNRVHLLSVSFDPEHDNYSVLKQYASHLQAKSDIWTFATVENAGDLGGMLRTFGITVIPDRQGGFQHNAALIWVSPSGHLVRVTDYDFSDPLRLLNELASLN